MCVWFDLDGRKLTKIEERAAHFEAIYVANFLALVASGQIPDWK